MTFHPSRRLPKFEATRLLPVTSASHTMPCWTTWIQCAGFPSLLAADGCHLSGHLLPWFDIKPPPSYVQASAAVVKLLDWCQYKCTWCLLGEPGACAFTFSMIRYTSFPGAAVCLEFLCLARRRWFVDCRFNIVLTMGSPAFANGIPAWWAPDFYL